MPKAKYGIPRNEGTASKATTRETEEIAKEISNSPITKATVRPVDKEPVVDNSKPKTPEHPFSNIPEAHYVPPNTKNFGAPAEKIPKDKEAVGLDLRTSAFAHDQLYVALSRCTSATRIKVILNENNVDGRTANIVYKKVLTGII